LEGATAAGSLVAAADSSQLLAIYREQHRLLSERSERADLGLVLACGAEMSRRYLGLDPRSGQLLVAAALADGYFTEFPTGEGKTLAIALAALWLAPRFGNVHVMSANSYLAGRDAAAMEPLFAAAGITVQSVDDTHTDKAQRYRSDVVYTTMSRVALDLLTDRLASKVADRIDPLLGALVVDEADAVLVDDAARPFVVTGSGPRIEDLDRYWRIGGTLERDTHFQIDEQRRTVWLTETGIALAEESLGTGLYDRPRVAQWLHAALLVRSFYRPDQEYVLQEGRPVLIDPHTGRPRPNARLSLGLQPMLETSVGLTPEQVPVVFARSTTRGTASLYRHLCGTGGTLESDRDELRALYGRETVVIPAHNRSSLVRHPDRVYLTRDAKIAALCAEIVRRQQTGQPLLIGTSTVADAEAVSIQLDQLGVSHRMLSARDPRGEAEIIAGAGRRGAVTIAARLAGRGVDIPLERDATNGLCVIAAERFPSRREDRQLVGRCARNGEPGEAIAFVSCEDDLLRVYGGSALDSAVASLRGGESESMEIPGISGLLERAQRQLESAAATARAEQIPLDDLRERLASRFASWRVRLLEGPGLQPGLEGLYRRRLAATAAPWRRKANLSRVGSCWPADVPVPAIADRDACAVLASTAVERVNSTAKSQVPPDETDKAVEALQEALLEVADSEWSALLEEIEVIGTAQAQAPLQVLTAELYRAEEAFWERLDTRVARLVWGASFRAPGGGVRPGGSSAPSRA
jgi:preprotein translocase subunit SecA